MIHRGNSYFLSLDDLIADNAEYVEKYKKLLEQAEKSNTRQANTIKKLTEKNKELETKVTDIEKLIEENKKSQDLLKERDKAIARQLKTIEKLEKENENLKSKSKIKEAVKKGTRGRKKTETTAEDIDIDGILEEGLN